MQNQTIEYYNRNTKEFVDRTIVTDMSYCQGKLFCFAI